ncbi:hypothetical protein Scep_001066 [Stephania cephalantha]|uniref:Cytochrome P450 n=1 Tax=Stephania cephalantha TaxID=152367 RepID=A0AAP0L8C6_9MAGN
MEVFYYIAMFTTLLFLLSKHYLIKPSQSSPPGPRSLPIIGHLHLLEKPFHRTLTNLAKQYGPVMFLRYGSRPVLVVSSTSTIQQCMTTNDLAFGNRPHLTVGAYLGYNYSSIIWSNIGDHWRNLRRIITVELFSSARLQMFLSLRVEEIHYMIEQVLLKANYDYESFTRVEFKSMFFELMLNIMMRTIAGKRYCGEGVEKSDEARRFHHVVSETMYLMGASNLGDFLPLLRWFDFQGLEKRIKDTHRERDSLLQEFIDGGNRHVIGDHGVGLLASPEPSNGPKKAKEEIDAQVGQRRLLSESDLADLPYLQSIVNETLRLYPTGPIVIHESAQDCAVDGFEVRAGTMLLMNVWALQRDPKVWDEPNEFRPERFEGSEWDKGGFRLVPFGSGRRRCPGEGMAMRVIGLTLGLLVQCFDWEREGENLVDMSEGLGLTLPRAKPLVAMCRPRLAMKNVLFEQL